ncbi:MAG: sulfurtransferase TusA family protein [Nitrososphaerales archaeon]
MKIDTCDFPDELLYDVDSGVWVLPASGVLRVGITSLLSWSWGTVSAVSFKGAGTHLQRGDVAGSVEGPRHFDVVRTPVTGVVLRANGALLENPKLLNKDPYGSGWFMEIGAGGPTGLSHLQKLSDAKPLIVNRLHELRVRCFAEFPDHEMFEIGIECSAVLVKLNEVLDRSPSGTVVHVVSDDGAAQVEMERWMDLTGNKVLESRKEGNLYHFIAKKT